MPATPRVPVAAPREAAVIVLNVPQGNIELICTEAGHSERVSVNTYAPS